MLEWTRIFAPEGTNTYLSWSWYATGAAISLLSIILFIMDLVNCTPFSGNWDVLIAGRQCRFSVPAFGLASSMVNLTLEIIPLVLVQKVIWGLHMSWKKLGVSLIFLIGIMYVAHHHSIKRKKKITDHDRPIVAALRVPSDYTMQPNSTSPTILATSFPLWHCAP